MTVPPLPHQATDPHRATAHQATDASGQIIEPHTATGSTPPRHGQPGTPTESAATRHLCAAAYLDDDFRQTSLREVYYQAKRLVAPSYGFQLVPVLWHCLRARNMAIVRDASVLGVLLLAACISFPAAFAIIVALTFFHFGVASWRLTQDAMRQLRSGEQVQILTILTRGALLVLGIIVAVFGVAFFGTAVLAAVTAAALSSSSETDAFALVAVAQGTGLLLGLVLLALPVAANVWRQRQIELLVPGGRPPHPPRLDRLAEIDRQQHGNTVVYSGYTPFVGSGEIIDTWGFAQRLVRPANALSAASTESYREFVEPPFAARDIVSFVGGQLHALTTDPDPAGCIPGMTVEDRVFLAGTEVAQLSPVTQPQELAEIIRSPTTPARHYLACQVVSWRGELVTTVYVHFALQGRSLYLEITTTALPPCDDRYRIVDQVDGTGAGAYLRAIWRGVVDTPRTVGAAPFKLASTLIELIAASVGDASSGSSLARGYDRGARVGVRELGAAKMTRNHTQTQDIIKHKRIIERRVVAAVLDFLESRGVDTNEYRQRALTILNAGAVNTGSGTMHVDTAIGQQNQAAASPQAGAGQ